MRATPQGVKPCGSLHLREFSDYSTLREAEGVFPVMRLHRKVLQWIIEGMLKKTFKWGGIILLVLYIALVIYRGFVLRAEEKTESQVAKIHATKLALVDVMGENLPPVPSDPDSSVAGVDANKNGIRDDVELAIFAEYPNSARARAVLLQYALALQMEVTQPIVNEGTVIAVAQDRSRASKCIGDAVPRNTLEEFIKITETYTEFVTRRQVNTQARDNSQKRFYEHLDSYSDLDDICDIELSTLPN